MFIVEVDKVMNHKLVLMVLVSVGITSLAHANMSFTGLGDLAGGSYYSQAWAISSDGSTVVGSSFSDHGREAFRWTQSEGMIGLGDLIGGGSRAIPIVFLKMVQ